MHEIPHVGLDGLIVKNEQVEDRPTFMVNPLTEGEKITGYLVNIPMPPGLTLPKFDIQGWNDFVEEKNRAEQEYIEATHTWYDTPGSERGAPPVIRVVELPILWIEGSETLPEVPTPETNLQKLQRLEQEMAAKDVAIAGLNASIIDLWEAILGGGV